MSTQSVSAYLAVMLISMFLLSLYLVVHFAESQFPWHTYVTLTLGYYATFSILLLVPIDIASAVIERRTSSLQTDNAYDENFNVISVAYNTFFVAILILGSFILVFEEYYNSDGYFTVGTKMFSAFKRMCFDMAIPCVAGAIILGILIDQKIVGDNAEALKLTAIILTNTIYESGLMFLLGYSLIELPRSLWQISDLDRYLLSVQMKAASEFKDISEAQLSVSLAVADVIKTKAQISSHADKRLLDAIEKIQSQCPPEFRSSRSGTVASNKNGQITIDTLASLRLKLNETKSNYRMAQAKVEGTKILAYQLEDIVAAKNAKSGVIHWSLTDKDSTPFEYKWHTYYKPIAFKIAAIIFAILSIFSFLGVICSMHGVDNNVSVYFIAVHDADSTLGRITLFILITLGYTAYLTIWSIFQMRLGGKMELVPHRTTPKCLSFNVRMCARLAAPLAFFYLGWISENGIKKGDWLYNDAPDTYVNGTVPVIGIDGNVTYVNGTITLNNAVFVPSAFSDFYQLQSVGIIQKTFGTVFPILLFCVVGLIITNIFNRLLVFAKLEQYQFGAEIVTDEQLREGKRQLLRHKKTTERAYRRGDLKSFILNVGKGTGGGILSFLTFGLIGSKDPLATKERESNISEAAERFTVREPAVLSGPLERKGAGKLGIGTAWKECYGEVKSPGYLHIHKDKKGMNIPTGDPSVPGDPLITTVIDLRLIMDFKVPDKGKNKDNLELDLELAEEEIKLKFRNLSEVENWRLRLQEWKDFCIDYGTMYPNGITGGAATLPTDLPPSTATPSARTKLGQTMDMMRGKSGRYDEELDGGGDQQDEVSKGTTYVSSATPLVEKKRKDAYSPFRIGGKVDRLSDDSSPPKKESISDGAPEALEGWLEKKSGGKVMGSDWHKRYVRVDEKAGMLLYFKTNKPSEKPAGSIDLKLAETISNYDKSAVATGKKAGSVDHSRFNIDMGEDGKVFKFKAADAEEGERWVHLLNEWKDNFLMNMYTSR